MRCSLSVRARPQLHVAAELLAHVATQGASAANAERDCYALLALNRGRRATFRSGPNRVISFSRAYGPPTSSRMEA
jgi:hypothetical protein